MTRRGGTGPVGHRRGTWRVVLAGAVAATAAGGCGGGDTSLDMTLRRVSLDLAFKDPKQAKKTITVQQVIDEGIPLPAAAVAVRAIPRQVIAGPASPALPVFIPSPPDPMCKVAPTGTLPLVPASTLANKPPLPGRYITHQTGTVALVTALGTIKVPAALESQVGIQNISDVSTTGVTGAITRVLTFDYVTQGLSGSVYTTYSITPTELQLVQIKDAKNLFKPTPSITIMQFKDIPGTSWNSAGVDVDSKEAMVVQGSIIGRENVDVCGVIVETYRISSSEQRVNPQTQYNYQTTSGDPKIYNIATQYGALFTRIHENSTTTGTSQNTPYQVTVNVTSTINSLTPKNP